MSPGRLVTVAVAVLVTALSVWLVVRTGLLAEALPVLRGASIPPILAALAITALIQWLRAWRFQLLLDGRPGAPSRGMLRAACLHLALNLYLPMRLGELSFPFLARRLAGTPLLPATGALIAARLLDLGALIAVLAPAAAWVLRERLGAWALLAVPVPLLAIGMVWGVAHLGDRLAHHLARYRSLAQKLAPVRVQLRAAIRRHVFGRVVLASLGIWLCHGTIAWLAITALGLGSTWPEGLFVGLAANAAFALPIGGVAGVGPVQAAYAWALHLTGTGLPEAIAAAIATHGILLAGAALQGGLAAVGRWRAPGFPFPAEASSMPGTERPADRPS